MSIFHERVRRFAGRCLHRLQRSKEVFRHSRLHGAARIVGKRIITAEVSVEISDNNNHTVISTAAHLSHVFRTL